MHVYYVLIRDMWIARRFDQTRPRQPPNDVNNKSAKWTANDVDFESLWMVAEGTVAMPGTSLDCDSALSVLEGGRLIIEEASPGALATSDGSRLSSHVGRPEGPESLAVWEGRPPRRF